MERNLRIHFTAGAFALYFSRYYKLPTVEMAILIFCIGFVIVCEMINTAIEKTVDLETQTFSTLAKIAKDVAAGAVLVSAATALAVGFLLFWNIDILAGILNDIAARPLPFILAFLLSAAWIFLPQKRT